jgi:hypothetical protein
MIEGRIGLAEPGLRPGSIGQAARQCGRRTRHSRSSPSDTATRTARHMLVCVSFNVNIHNSPNNQFQPEPSRMSIPSNSIPRTPSTKSRRRASSAPNRGRPPLSLSGRVGAAAPTSPASLRRHPRQTSNPRFPESTP